MNTIPPLFAGLVTTLALLGCADDHEHAPHDHDHHHGSGDGTPQRMFVVGDGKLKAFDIESAAQLSGEITGVTRLTDLMALDDGFVLGNLTDDNEVLVVDGRSMLEEVRLPSSGAEAVRPVHGYLSPSYDGKQYWLVFNDGNGALEENSVTLIDVSPSSTGRFQGLGEFPLGIGHHKASFSKTQPRVSVSNSSDCEVALHVLDFTDPSDIRELARFSAEDLGWDGSSIERTCDSTRQNGTVPSPHGSANGENGKSYHNLTGSGDMVEIDIDADPPTFRIIMTGSPGGGGYTTSGLGAYIYTLHSEPREGNGGAVCQIGQLTVLDTSAAEGDVVSEVPVFYEGPDCDRSLLGTDEESAYPGHVLVDTNNGQLFLTPAGGFANADARVRQELVLDASDGAHPVQLSSIPVGSGTGHMNDALTGDGRYVLVVGTIDGTVSVIDTALREVVRTITVGPNPTQVASWGSAEGPSHRTGPVE